MLFYHHNGMQLGTCGVNTHTHTHTHRKKHGYVSKRLNGPEKKKSFIVRSQKIPH